MQNKKIGSFFLLLVLQEAMKAFMDMPSPFQAEEKRENYTSLDDVDGNLEEDRRSERQD